MEQMSHETRQKAAERADQHKYSAAQSRGF